MIDEDHPLALGCIERACRQVQRSLLRSADLIVGPRLRHRRGRVRGLDRRCAAAADRHRAGRYRALGQARPSGDRRSRRFAGAACGAARRRQRLERADAGRPSPRLPRRAAPGGASFTAHAAIDAVRRALPRDGLLAFDVGAHTHQIASQWTAHAPKSFLITNGWSSMGFGLPAAIAAKLARPDLPVVCLIGDGCFQMTCGEVAIAKRLGLALPIVVLDDRWLALIKVKQIRRQFPLYGTELQARGLSRAARALFRRAGGRLRERRGAGGRGHRGARRRGADRDRGRGRLRALSRNGLRLRNRVGERTEHGPFGVGGRHPGPVRQLMAEPGGLALGVAAGVALAALGGFGERDLAREVAHQPRHAMRLHRRQARIEAARSERRDLVKRAGCQHRVEARVDATIELGTIGIEKHLDRAGGVERGLHAVAVPVGERTPGRQNHLERAGDAGAIARHQPVRGRRVAAHQARHRAGRCPRPRAARAPPRGCRPGSAGWRQARS